MENPSGLFYKVEFYELLGSRKLRETNSNLFEGSEE